MGGGRLPHSPTAKGGTHPPWGVGPRAWCPESNFPTAKNKRPPSRRLLPLLTVVTAMMAVSIIRSCTYEFQCKYTNTNTVQEKNSGSRVLSQMSQTRRARAPSLNISPLTINLICLHLTHIYDAHKSFSGCNKSEIAPNVSN